jgi:GntR family transcriptional regulator
MIEKSATAIAADIRKGIETGRYRYGTRLPGARALATEYGVSHQTIAAACAILAALGFVRTERNSGTTVTAGPKSDAHLGTFTPPDLAAALPWKTNGGGQVSEETTLVRQMEAPTHMADWGIPEGSQVVERTRIRSVDGTPVQYKLSVFPYEIAARRPEGHDGVPPMLAPVGAAPVAPPKGVRMADWLGWDVAGTECVITADPMDAAASTALGLAEGTPGFRVLAITRDPAGGTVFVTITIAPLHHRVTLDIVG